MSRLFKTLAFAAVLSLGVVGLTRAEVWVELDGSGHVVATHIPSSRNSSHVWRTTGAAPALAQVLNAAGASRGDGRPDIAIDPVSGLPRAVWSMRTGGGFDIVTSTFDGRAWTEPIPVTGSFGIDDLDPRIAFRADGLAAVTWWTNTAISTVQLAVLPHGGAWRYLGTMSVPGERAKAPAVSLEGDLAIIAYRNRLGMTTITKHTLVDRDFGDGPTPFPRDSGNSGPSTGDAPPPPPPGNP